jgi:hypothetical protein
MYYTGLDPFTKKPVQSAKGLHDRKLQRALMQFFKPENYFAVREALVQAGRQDLIGDGCDCLIPSQPPKEALASRRKHANQALRADYYHAVPNPAKGGAEVPVSGRGYRPGRKTQQRRQKPDRGSDE